MGQVILVRLSHDVVGCSVPVSTDVINNGVNSVIPLLELIGGVLLFENSFTEGCSKCHRVAPVEVWRAD